MRRGAPISPRPLVRGVALAVVFTGLSVLVGGCTQGAAGGNDLQARAQEYMDLRQKGSWDEIWNGMVDPTARDGLDRDKFMARRRSSFDIVDFEIVSVDEEGQSGRVVARLDAVVPVLKPGGGTMRIPRELDDAQQWVQRDGRWYIQLPS